MRRSAVVFFSLLSLVAIPLFAIRITSVDDVIRLHNGGATHEFILAAIERSSGGFEVTPDDIVAMNRAGLSQEVIEAVIDAAKPRATAAPGTPQEPADQVAARAPEGEEEAEGEADWTFDPPIFLFPPGWVIPRWLWDPHWSMPTLDRTTDAGARRTQSNVPASRPATAASAEPHTAAATSPKRSTTLPQPERNTARPPL